MTRELTYKQVYLAPQRGWIPESPAEVLRKRYGDCKDLATFFMAQAKGLGLQAAPVLALIQGGRLDPAEAPFFGAFNHAIAAVALEQPWGFPAEVATPMGRFLLHDPTSSLTPFGLLPAGLAGTRVLICTAQGAAWVAIPETATERPALALRLRGKLDQDGQFQGDYRILETGDAWGLRQAATAQDKAKLKDYLLRTQEDLPATGTLEVTSVSDPYDLEKPFEVVFKLVYPKAARLAGAEWELAPWGMVRLPGTIQKLGSPRKYPVFFKRDLAYQYTAEWECPWPLVPVLAKASLDSPWRTGTWSAQAKTEAGACQLLLNYQEQGRAAEFPFARREEGVAEWKKDRAAVKRLRQDGLTFKRAQ